MEGHDCIVSRISNGDWICTCSCGQNWTQAKERSQEYIVEIYRSHLKYFNRPATQTL